MDSDDESDAADAAQTATPYNTKEQETICRVYKAFILENNMPEIIRILLEDDVNMHYSVVTDCTALLKVDMTLADVLFFHSDKAFEALDSALEKVCEEVYKNHTLKLQMTLKPNLHARMKNIPVCPELWRERVPKSKDINKFLAIEGTVIRTSSVKLLEYEKELMCSKCQNLFTLKADFVQHYRIPTPSKCPVRPSCNSKQFVMVSNETSAASRKCKDFQEIKIQEQMRRLAMGTIPRVITVVLEDDLVDVCKAGDDVVIYAALKCRWQPLQIGKPCNLELVLKANYVEVRNEQRLGASVKEEMQNDFECFWAAHAENPMTARNHILASLCPQIYGLYVVKLAVALVLAGGVRRTDASGSSVRGEAHLLLVGDPGTGKSQFLKYASKITPRSVLTTGTGSTGAGLTVTAIRDGPHWTLEAGALVLADGGICCIDEFSSIKEHDRGAIHEAMEQQTVSVAKAGLVCKLNTRTSVLAATNPKLGKYDESSSIGINVAIASPLLSRFDIVLVLLDGKNELWDSVVADYVLTGKDVTNNNRGKQKLWSMEQMQAYFCVVKQIDPVLSPSANKILSEYYRCHRRSDTRNAARTTIRLLESLIRIAEAHARLMYRQTVDVLDAVAAITIMESSMQGASLLPTGSVLHSCFPTNPEKEYQNHAQLVLKRLGLDEILQTELTEVLPPPSTNLNTTNFLPPASPLESKVFTGISTELAQLIQHAEKPSNTNGKLSTPRMFSSSRKNNNKEFSYNFEESVSFANIFPNTAKDDSSGHTFKTSTQNSPLNELPNFTNTSSLSIKSQTKKNETTRTSNIRSRLSCFKRKTPPPSPENDFHLSGIVSRGNKKTIPCKSTKTAEKMNSYNQITTNSQSSDGTASQINFNFCDSNRIDAAGPRETSAQFKEGCSKNINNSASTSCLLPLGKHSIFSLNASAIEEICDDLGFNEDHRFQSNFLSDLRDSQCVIKTTQDNGNGDNKTSKQSSTKGEDSLGIVFDTTSSDKPSTSKAVHNQSGITASNLFKVDDDFESLGIDMGDDFNLDFDNSQDLFANEKRKTFEL